MMRYCVCWWSGWLAGNWELQKLFRDRCYILPCFHSPYGTYRAIVEPSAGTSNKKGFETRHVEQAGPHNTPTLYIVQVWINCEDWNQFLASFEDENGKSKFVKTNTYKHKERKKITREPVVEGIEGTIGSVNETITCLSLWFFIRVEIRWTHESKRLFLFFVFSKSSTCEDS